jgi:hypothetical protein
MNKKILQELVRRAVTQGLFETKKPKVIEEHPVAQADRLGLTYIGYGKYADKKGKVVAETQGGKLVRTPKSFFGEDTDPATPRPKAKLKKPKHLTTESEAHDQATKMGLTYVGFGRYIDNTGKVVAKSINGQLTRIQPEEMEDHGVDPETEKKMIALFKERGYDPYVANGDNHISPGWNKGMDTDDIPFDANGEDTVMKLLAMVGDPAKLVRWLVKTFQKETPNGKKRILQYLGILKSMGLLDPQDAEGGAQQPAGAPAQAPRKNPSPLEL